MRSFGNLRIGVRLASGFAMVTALLVGTAVVGVSQVNAVNANAEIILHDRYVKVAHAHAIENEFNKQARAMRTALLTTDSAIVGGELKKIRESVPAIARAVERLEATIRTPKGKEALKSLVEARGALKAREDRLIAMIVAGQVAEGRDYLVRDMLPLQAIYLAAIDAFAQTQVDGMKQFGAESEDMAHGATVSMIVLAAIATSLAVVVAVTLTRSVTVPIANAVKVAQAVASGDLTSEIEVRSTDETGQLLSALKTMNRSLVGIVRQVRESSHSIAAGAAQIAGGNADLSKRTEEQASNLQQTAASMEQITATVKQSAAAARSATDLAGSAGAIAAKGGAVVGRVVETMGEISAGSRKIADITGVIDGIAFQTNILALNAAVEAARAGEQGRGFAVVAGEVRTLAQRAATAAKEIRSLIGQSVDKVDVGAELVGDAGTTMNEIVAQVQRVARLISEIDIATQEQTQGIGEVGDAVNQLDRVTQQNTALVEQSAASAESLEQQAVALTRIVGAFKLGGEEQRSTALT